MVVFSPPSRDIVSKYPRVEGVADLPHVFVLLMDRMDIGGVHHHCAEAFASLRGCAVEGKAA
jgi:hypothetical protein